jgi:hypothetical protein
MLAEFIDPALLGFVLIGVMLFSIFVGFPISFTLIFLGFVFGYLGFGKLVFLFNDLTIFYGHDRTNTRRCTTLCFHGYYDGTGRVDGKTFFCFSTNVSQG